MQFEARNRRSIKLLVFSTVLIFSAIFFTKPFERQYRTSASASGPSPSHSGAPAEANCTLCHGDFAVNSGSGNITISELPPNYRAGQQIPVTVTVNQSDAVIFGFQLTAVDSAGRRVGSYTLPAGSPPAIQETTGIVDGVERRYVSHTVNGITPSQFGTKSWTFTWNAPAQRKGKVTFYAAGNGANSDGGTGGDRIYTENAATLSGSALASFDADTKSDLSVWRPSNGVWYSYNSTDGNYQVNQFGTNGDKIAPGDYDADGKTDLAIWRPTTGFWYIRKSSGGFDTVPFGAPGDTPVPGDFDGDLKNDIAIWRPSTGVWYVLRSSDGGYDIRQFGGSGDIPTQADFDADGKTDLAVWRPSNGVWYIWRSSDNTFSIFGFGLTGDKPVQADHDGDGTADAAIYRPSEGRWYILGSSKGFVTTRFGAVSDTPAVADYDGDGSADIAVYRNGEWYALLSSDGTVAISTFGISGDVPVPSGYTPN
ncbi:MAG: choice-of-anchor V domain-containing protein [Pyrinomonadaceae bacterium]